LNYKEKYRRWMDYKDMEPELRAELCAIAQDDREIRERFALDLEFGTGGLRGVLGAGAGRESAVRAIQSAGMQVSLLKDCTPIPHNGCRPRKRRRV